MRPRIVAIGLAVIGAAVAAATGFLYAVAGGDGAGQDAQPIAFNHELHAGRLGVECLFCHRHAEYSSTAGVPSVSLCMSCHRSIEPDSPGMRELTAHWNTRTPIAWVRLQWLPDHVYFTHSMHLHEGMRCADCHGRVENMNGTPRAPSFEMGWCLSCHARRDAPRDCWTCHK